jgi:hypothetical protein
MNDETPTPEKKIFVDEDWKRQVEAEKAAARRAEAASQSDSPTAAQPEATASNEAKSRPLPPADLSFLIGTLYLQGAMALGLLPTADGKSRPVERDSARHVIDLLDVLQRKTEGNRTPDETAELEAALHELRLAFVAAR